MIKGKARRAGIDFKRGALVPQPTNYAVAVIDTLSFEIERLSATFKEYELPLVLRENWIENDLSLVVVLEEDVQDREAAPFVRLQFSPLSDKKAQVLASSAAGVKTKTYHHLDKVDCVNRMMADVRNHILAATPHGLKDSVEAVFVGLLPTDEAFKDYQTLKQTITEKYAGNGDPQAAYLKALQYQ